MSNILIGVSGGIAAYKIPSLVSVLTGKGHTVRVIMTEASKHFIGAVTFSALSHQPVFDDAKEFTPDGHITHIELADWADVFVVAPMTANTGAKIMQYFADNLLTSTVLAFTKPIIMFPAMNVYMWEKFKRTKEFETEFTYRYTCLEGIDALCDSKLRVIVLPDSGKMACGAVGVGKLVSTKVIVSVIETTLKK